MSVMNWQPPTVQQAAFVADMVETMRSIGMADGAIIATTVAAIKTERPESTEEIATLLLFIAHELDLGEERMAMLMTKVQLARLEARKRGTHAWPKR